MKTLLLSKTDVQDAVTMDEVIAAVEAAYKAYQRGQVEQPPIQGMEIPEHNAESDVKSCYNRDNHMFSIKTVGLFRTTSRASRPLPQQTEANCPT